MGVFSFFLEYGMEGHIPFLAMNYARKGSLQQIYSEGMLFSVDTIVSYVKQQVVLFREVTRWRRYGQLYIA